MVYKFNVIFFLIYILQTFQSLTEQCRVYPRGLGDFASPFWAIATILFGLAILILVIVALFSVVALCFRSLGKKSIFSVSGFLQGIAGMLVGLFSNDFYALYCPLDFKLGFPCYCFEIRFDRIGNQKLFIKVEIT